MRIMYKLNLVEITLIYSNVQEDADIGYLKFYVGISPYYYIAAAVMFVGVLLIARRLPIVQRISLSLLIPYVFMVVVATIIVRSPSAEPNIMLSPFETFKEALTNDFWEFELQANILMFIPVGFLLSMAINQLNGIPLFVGLLFSITIEVVQYFTQRGAFDVDDLITNSMGILIGFIIFMPIKMVLDTYLPPKKKKE